MRAAVIKAPGVLEVQDVPEPVCEPDEIKVKIAYAGICGTDPKIIDGTVRAAFPADAIGGPLGLHPCVPVSGLQDMKLQGQLSKLAKKLKAILKSVSMSP